MSERAPLKYGDVRQKLLDRLTLAGVALPERFIAHVDGDPKNNAPDNLQVGLAGAVIQSPFSVKAQTEHARISADMARVMAELTQKSRLGGGQTTTVQAKALTDYSNADLVMEMIKRGFAVLKCPEPGVAPEALGG